MRLRWSAVALLSATCLLLSCRPTPPTAPPPGHGGAATASLPFRDVADEAGIRFVHTRGETGAHYMPETMGAGCMFFDYNGDGWDDILLIQGAAMPGADAAKLDTRNRLYRNNRRGGFEEVPDAAGLQGSGYGMGCTAADVDNDGDQDVVITSFRGCFLYLNQEGRFTLQSAEFSGLKREGWAASAAFGDYDADGLVDLMVTLYVEYEPGVSPGCTAPNGSPGYCPPEVYPATQDRLYRNLGGGRFRDVSRETGIAAVKTRGMGVVWGDFDGDGDADLYVACDQSPNVLWRNENGRFRNVAVEQGCAYDEDGEILNGMGVDAGDPDHDGDPDLFITNFSGQPNSFYENLGRAGFRFQSNPRGLGLPSVRLLAFGCNYLDYNLDGWEDLFVANGHVNDHIALAVPDVAYAQPASLYRNLGKGRFRLVEPVPGQGIWRVRVSRGSAVADYDQDGDPDLLVTNSGDRAELFRNELPPTRSWLGIRLQGVVGNRDGIGAVLRVVTGTVQTREVRAGSSYLSQSSLLQSFGLGAGEHVREVSVRWPSGRTSRLANPAPGRIHTIREP